jgi:hypothetical protein
MASIAVAACGDSAETASPTVSQQITKDFGRTVLGGEDAAPLESHPNALRLLRGYEDFQFESGPTARNWTVMESIDGHRTDPYPGETTWVYIVNGVRAEEFPADYKLHPGDVVQWDLRWWRADQDAPATVGAFPQTFTNGILGKRMPVTVECEEDGSSPCRRVKRLLDDAGVQTDGSAPPGGTPEYPYPTHARVLVGRWSHFRNDDSADRLGMRIFNSGVFARFSPRGDSLSLLDADGHRVRSSGAETGLVAAMVNADELLWTVTGVDDAGVERAAAALDRPGLRNAYAVAVTEDGIEKLPLPR